MFCDDFFHFGSLFVVEADPTLDHRCDPFRRRLGMMNRKLQATDGEVDRECRPARHAGGKDHKHKRIVSQRRPPGGGGKRSGTVDVDSVFIGVSPQKA